MKSILLLCLILFTAFFLYPVSTPAEENVQEILEKAERGDPDALAWLEEIANEGNSLAQLFLGQLHKMGKGVQQDYHKAREWFEKSAAKNNGYAQMFLGFLYEAGQGVRQNYTRAKEYFGQACDNGLQAGCDQYAELNKKGY